MKSLLKIFVGMLLGITLTAWADDFAVITNTTQQIQQELAFSADENQLVELLFKVNGVEQINKSKTIPAGKTASGRVYFRAVLADK